MERKLASIQKIEEIKPIDGADRIVAYRIEDWWVVDSKDKYEIGNFVIFLEIDSFVPSTPFTSFLSKGNEPREYNGIKGERLKTVRLRKQISQGLILPLDAITTLPDIQYSDGGYVIIGEHSIRLWEVNTDVTAILGIQKWEPKLSANLRGIARGNFPSWARKTDQERCQHLRHEIKEAYDTDVRFEISLKMDGSSLSVGKSPDGDYVVCSRNMSLIIDQEGNSFVDVTKKYDLEEKLKDFPPIMISGELVGEGIQKNSEGIKGQDFYVFDIYDPMAGEYVSSSARYEITNKLGLKHVPILDHSTLKELGLDSVAAILEYAEGPSLFAKQREGIVFKSEDAKFSFKAISNSWLLSGKDE